MKKRARRILRNVRWVEALAMRRSQRYAVSQIMEEEDARGLELFSGGVSQCLE